MSPCTFANYQRWLEEWDRVRTWDKVLPSHVLLHAMEELGEVSRLVQVVEGYRSMDGVSAEQIRADLELEFSDLQVMLFKIAYLCDIDMESAMMRGQAKADRLFPNPDEGPAERDAYWQRFREYLAKRGLTVDAPPDN